MIYITQGSDKGIGVEIFLRSLITLSKKQTKNLCLIINNEVLIENLHFLKINYKITANSLTIFNREIKLIQFDSNANYSNALQSILIALERLTKQDKLITQPASKEDFTYKGKNFLGHTEFFRYWFKTEVAMMFTSPKINLLLVTDHVPLNKVSKMVDKKTIQTKVSLCQNFLKNKIKEIIYLGINPHAGEGGLLGTEEKELPEIQFIPGDSLALNNFSTSQLIVSPFHDQGLTYFKTINGLFGINISLGLPFLRVSVDHGTAPSLYGKNCADVSSMVYLLDKLLNSRI